MTRVPWLLIAALLGLSCQGGAPQSPPRLDFALAIHGGAGVIDRTLEGEVKEEYLAALRKALRVGVEILESGGTSLDAVEQVVRSLEDEPRFNAAKAPCSTTRGLMSSTRSSWMGVPWRAAP